MSQPPTPYARIFDFEAFSTNNPATQQPGVQFEGEFDAIKLTLDGLVSRLSEIQRDDGKLRDTAFDDTDIIENIQEASYAAVYSLLFPLVGQAETHANAASASASASQTSANQAAAYVAQALQHRNDAAVSAALSASQALQAQQSLGQVNVAAGTAQSAAAQAEQSKIAAEAAAQSAEESLGSVQQLKQTLDNQYDNMLDSDQNLADVSSKSQSVTNLGLDAENHSDRSVYNRLKWMVSMYENPTAGNNDLPTIQGNFSVDGFLENYFGIVFNQNSGLFQKTSGTITSEFGSGVASNGLPTDVINTNTPLEERIEILKRRMSVVQSCFRTTLLQASEFWGFNGDNRLITLQDFQIGQDGSQIKYHVWRMVDDDVYAAISNTMASSDAPADGLIYGRKDNGWTEVVGGAGKIQDYDNFKVYNAGDQVVFADKIYKFNAFIGAAGYAPDTHSYAWTELSAGVAGDFLPLSGGTITGVVTVDGNNPFSDGFVEITGGTQSEPTMVTVSSSGGSARTRVGPGSVSFEVDGDYSFFSAGSAEISGSPVLTKADSFKIDNSTQYALPILATQFTGFTSGTGSLSDHFNSITNATNSATRRLFAPTSSAGYGIQQIDLNFMSRGVDHFAARRSFNWSRKMSISFSLSLGSFASSGGSESVFSVKIGFSGLGSTLYNIGKGISLSKSGTAPFVVFYNYFDGAGVQSVQTGFNPGSGMVYNIVLDLDGLGGFSLSVDGAVVFQGPYAPVGIQETNSSYPIQSALTFTAENMSTPSVRASAVVSFVKVSIVNP